MGGLFVKYIANLWRCFVDTPFLNVRMIFPSVQRDVSKIVEHAKTDSNIKKVMIFGSSVTWACCPHSDIDLYYELEREEQVDTPLTDRSIDKWNNFTVDYNLLSEIKNKGVVVYERDAVG